MNLFVAGEPNLLEHKLFIEPIANLHVLIPAFPIYSVKLISPFGFELHHPFEVVKLIFFPVSVVQSKYISYSAPINILEP